MLFANICAGIFLFWYGVGGGYVVFWVFVASPWYLVHLGGASFAGHPPCVYKVLGFKDVPPTGHALWAEVGSGIIFATPGEFAGQHKKLPVRY